jgi:hypothetical protein
LALWVVPNSSEILDVEIRKDLDLPIAATALAVCLAAAFPGARYGALSTY